MLYLQVVNLSIVQFTSAHAQVKPGELITYENVAKIKDLVSPGTYYKVDHGMSMKIPANSLPPMIAPKNRQNGGVNEESQRCRSQFNQTIRPFIPSSEIRRVEQKGRSMRARCTKFFSIVQLGWWDDLAIHGGQL
jgi:hypothetical protein